MEREPLQAADLPAKVGIWLQDVGGFAAAGLVIWVTAYLLGQAPPASGGPRPRWLRTGFTALAALAGAFYLIVGVLKIPDFLAWLSGAPSPAAVAPELQEMSLTLGGMCAILAALLPFVVDLARLRLGRVWAIARLSIREGVHRWVMWIFCPLLLLFLVAGWFLPLRPESQLRSYIQIISWAMTPLLLVTAALLAAFSIPGDVRSQTVATIVTKPVERFEIVLGRFIGYLVLMSAILATMTAISLVSVYLLPVAPASAFESYRARVPLFGKLELRSKDPKFKGTEGLKEWEYRRYIAGHPQSSQRANWLFDELPTRLDERGSVPCEFSFDIYRMRKPEADDGVPVTFVFETRNWDPARQTEYVQEREDARRRLYQDPAALAAEMDRLAERYGIYEVPSKKIVNFRTYTIDVPSGLFRNAQRDDFPQRQLPPLNVSLKCEEAGQFVGVARYDLWFVDAEGFFGVNFFKGTLGLWFSLCVVIGVAVALSTYLSGVISLVTTLLIYLGGYCSDFITKVATAQTDSGGPAESFRRMVSNLPPTVDDPTPTARVAHVFDEGFRWYLRRLLNVLPDVELFALSDRVAQGFDISGTDLLLRLIVLFGYLLPWGVLAYYLMKSREIAS